MVSELVSLHCTPAAALGAFTYLILWKTNKTITAYLITGAMLQYQHSTGQRDMAWWLWEASRLPSEEGQQHRHSHQQCSTIKSHTHWKADSSMPMKPSPAAATIKHINISVSCSCCVILPTCHSIRMLEWILLSVSDCFLCCFLTIKNNSVSLVWHNPVTRP